MVIHKIGAQCHYDRNEIVDFNEKQTSGTLLYLENHKDNEAKIFHGDSLYDLEFGGEFLDS